MKNSTGVLMLVTLWKCIEKWQKEQEIVWKTVSYNSQSNQTQFICNIMGLNQHEVDSLLSRSEFVIKKGNKHSKRTIEKKVQRGRGEGIDKKNPKLKTNQSPPHKKPKQNKKPTGGNNRKKQFYWKAKW